MREKGQKTTKVNSPREFGIWGIENILQELKKELKTLYGGRLKKLILYGSYARAEAWKDSDIDVVVLLDGEVSPGKEIDRMIDIITDLNLKYNVLLSVYPTSEKALQKIKSPLLLNIQREGVTI
ncbi:MAG: nucleotidyltransferase domain-containing protein [Planctomycetes bacterium]|nr:nucleotidyltransferase domain-containing protein [Planctomycetota bacterium]